MAELRPQSSLKKASADPAAVVSFQLQGRYETLPEELRRCRNLRHLILKGNGLRQLPVWIGELTALESLTLVNQVSELVSPASLRLLASLPGLRELEVSMFSRGLALPEELGGLTGLTRLAVTFCELEEVPASLTRLRALERLDLSNNHLTSVASDLGACTALRELRLADNRISLLPASVGQLHALEELRLSKNQLADLPETLSACTRLTKLCIDSNQFTALPAVVPQLTSLRHLDCGNNPLRAFPETLSALAALEQLHAPSCGLRELPASVASLAHLSYLNLNTNALADLPREVASLPQLTFLLVKSNQLRTLPPAMLTRQGMKRLMVGGNPLTPEDIAALVRALPGCEVDYSDTGLDAKQQAKLKALVLAALGVPGDAA